MRLFRDKAKGALIGLAVGDALGAQVEFSERGVIVDDFKSTYPNPWKLPTGGWTDDTAMALCLADGLLAGENLETQPELYMNRFLRWVNNGENTCSGKVVGIGGTTLKALKIFQITGKVLPDTSEHASGNGCIMRLAPVSIYHHFLSHANRNNGTEYETGYMMAGHSAKLTHGSNTAIFCTSQFNMFIDKALWGWRKECILDAWCGIPADMLHILRKNYIKKTPSGTIEHKFGNTYYTEAELKSDGYCVNTLECALWAFYHSESFEEGMIKAIALGGDTDTVGAVYGQLAGAFYGYDQIPTRWTEKLIQHDHIVSLAEKLTSERLLQC